MEDIYQSKYKEAEEKVKKSPCGKYTLTIEWYQDKESEYWAVSRGLVRNSSGKLLFDIKRDYSSFPYLFVSHPNGNDYLVCGEHYQGYNILNLTTGQNHAYMNEGADLGFGLCWSNKVKKSPDSTKLVVYGCIWGGPYQFLVYDFSDPDRELPLLFDDRACFSCYSSDWKFTETGDLEIKFKGKLSDDDKTLLTKIAICKVEFKTDLVICRFSK